MRIDRRDEEGVRVLTVAEPGEIDLDRVDDFRASVNQAIGDAKRVVLDCTLVEFFDSAGMGSLLAIQKEIVERRGGAFALTGLQRNVLEVFRMVGFDVIFVFRPDVATAVAALRG
jgi:anti-anti-sigma factor